MQVVTRLLVVATLLYPAGVMASVCTDAGGVDATENPIGFCDCDNQIHVAAGCESGYWCFTAGDETGCSKTCEPGEYLATDYINNYWECIPITNSTPARLFDFDVAGKAFTDCPIDTGYHVCPDDTAALTPIPIEDVTGNPLGNCRCDGELWVSEGCAYGFVCDSTEPTIGGEYISCPIEGENIHVIDFDAGTWNCSTSVGNCPGGVVNGVGCDPVECQYSVNPFGECGCDGQFFMNDDCTQGFLCLSEIPDAFLFDGCFQKCLDGQVLVPDFTNQGWECVDADQSYICPGSFNVYCEHENIGTGFTKEDCECEGQLLVTDDCRESFYCVDFFQPEGGASLVCEEGQIVDVDFETYSWQCTDNVGNCPGLGGFQLGCDGNAIPPPPLACNYTTNHIGDCGCEAQLFINDNCTQSFYCSEIIPDDVDPLSEGCELNCVDGERVHLDLVNNIWECVDREDDYICPGQFENDCEANFDVECECEDQYWVNAECTQIFICDGEIDNNINPGNFGNCGAGTYVNVSFTYPYGYECVADPDVCSGKSFHFGCRGDLTPLTSTTEEDSTTMPESTTPFVPTSCNYVATNDLGDCECDGEIFVNNDCTESFFCVGNPPDGSPAGSVGCELKCNAGDRIELNLIDDTWECVTMEDTFICPGKFNVDCVEPDEVVCECRNQVWMNADCTSAYNCLGPAEGGINPGIAHNCLLDGYTLEISYQAPVEINCVQDPNGDMCPGSYHFGCTGELNNYTTPEPDTTLTPPVTTTNVDDTTITAPALLQCATGDNTLDECNGCDGQFFVDTDCRESFICTDRIPDSDQFEGCFLTCEEDERVELDFTQEIWECVPREDNFLCPGKFNTDCTDRFHHIDCSCEYEVWVNEDCRQGFICDAETLSGEVNTGGYYNCPSGYVLEYDLFYPGGLDCKVDQGQCPGSFHFGCDGSDFGLLTSTPADTTTPASAGCILVPTNDLGDCECDGEIFVNDDCTESFFCVEDAPDGNVGCDLKCEDDERIELNLVNDIWRCVPKEDTFVCPGKFNVDCVEPDEIVCECRSQYWMNGDCSSVYRCQGPADENGTNSGQSFNCLVPGEVATILYQVPIQVTCEPDPTGTKCPGSYHFGCEGDLNEYTSPVPDTTLTPPVTTTNDDTTITAPALLQCDTYATNQLGECTGCNDQMFVNYDCTESFVCSDNILDSNQFEGCSQSCPDGQRLDIDFSISQNAWGCVHREDNFLCPGAFNTDCRDRFNIDCGCEHEVWVNGDCTTGFICEEETVPGEGVNNGGYYNCAPGYILAYDLFYPGGLECQVDEGQCRGSFHFGCDGGNLGEITSTLADTTTPVAQTTTVEPPLLECDRYSDNVFGDCSGCNEQVFVNQDCTKSFVCSDNIPEPDKYEGCYQSCEVGQRIEIDFSQDVWECVDEESDFFCPGSFNTDCQPRYDIECECRYEVWVNGDCTEAFICDEPYETGDIGNSGINVNCDPGQIINVDFTSPGRVFCIDDHGHCPGSYHLGCDGGDFGSITTQNPDITTNNLISTEEPPLLNCDVYGPNVFGDCSGCNNQVFVNQDCSASFVCSDNIPDPDDDAGCYQSCPAGQRIEIDFSLDIWECVDEESDFFCPGKFNTDCEPNYDFQCECRYQVWVNGDCTDASICNEAYETGDIGNQVTSVNCGPGQIINVDLTSPGRVFCIDDHGHCPGSYHFGCDGGDFGSITTEESPIITTDSNEPPPERSTLYPPLPGSATSVVVFSSLTVIMASLLQMI